MYIYKESMYINCVITLPGGCVADRKPHRSNGCEALVPEGLGALILIGRSSRIAGLNPICAEQGMTEQRASYAAPSYAVCIDFDMTSRI